MRAVNLVPYDSRAGSAPGAGRSGGGAYAVLAVLGALAVLALLYGIAHHQVSSRTSQAADLTARAQRAQAEAGRLAPYTNFIALREQRMRAVSELVDARFDWAHAFHELGRVLPQSASITTLDGTVGGTEAGASAPAASPAAPATSTAGSASSTSATGSASVAPTVTSATPPGSVPTFTLSGCATSQQQVAVTLTRLRLIDGVGEVTLQSSTKSAATSAAGGSGGTGSCEGGDPAFTIQVTFAALPSSAAIGSATKLTSAKGAGR
jgi:Tfp pilus assembly protein PilN